VLLQAGQLLSSAGTQSTTIVYTLLTLALTGSPARTGVVGFARTAPIAVFALLAGATADRFDRKRVMICADLARAAATGGLALALLTGRASFAAIVAVALVEGTGYAFFAPAASGALRSVVPPHQLGDAAGAEQARLAIVRLGGPPLGGALYGLGRAVPFVVDAASYVISLVSIVLMRTPFQETREREPQPLRARVAAGLRFVWEQPFLRTTALIFSLLNMVAIGGLLGLVVIGRRQGLSGGEIGALVAAFGAAMLVGSLVSPVARRHLPPGAILVLELWTWPLSAAFVLRPSVYVLAAAMIPCGLAIPITDSALIGYRLAITPDRLVGRVASVQTAIVMVGAPLGALGAGVLLDVVGAQATIAAFAAVALGLAVWGTLSPSIRSAPKLAQINAPTAGH
jgi:predicted MFS family arabinose efflux permease